MRSWIASGLVCFAIASGCDRQRPQTAAAPSPSPATLPATPLATIPLPTTQAAAASDNAPDGCVMTINQQPVEFPPARVRIKETNGQMVAFLYSDDPKEALDNNYRGNGFYFEMPLDVANAQFDRASWTHQSESGQRVETPYGIFLDGHRRQLQPLDVRVRLRPAISGGLKVEMAGTFLSVDPQDELAATAVVPVAGWLLAEKR